MSTSKERRYIDDGVREILICEGRRGVWTHHLKAQEEERNQERDIERERGGEGEWKGGTERQGGRWSD